MYVEEVNKKAFYIKNFSLQVKFNIKRVYLQVFSSRMEGYLCKTVKKDMFSRNS